MYIDQNTIERAFQKHGEFYDGGAWNIPYHVECWRYGIDAFEGPSLSGFERIYDELRRRWQAFRGTASAPWTPAEAFERFGTLPNEWRLRSLSQFHDDGLAPAWDIINAIRDIKPMKSAPSVVAISKFLHFWNPRLFVIVDYEVIWKWVFAHRWLKQPIADLRRHVQECLPDASCLDAGSACDLLSYLAVIRWSADIIRKNPSIGPSFANHVRTHAKGDVSDIPLETYEGAAIEWLLLGLVQVPPEGVSTTPSRIAET